MPYLHKVPKVIYLLMMIDEIQLVYAAICKVESSSHGNTAKFHPEMFATIILFIYFQYQGMTYT